MARKLQVALKWGGVWDDAKSLPKRAGIYMVIAGSKASNGKWQPSSYKLLDIGQSGKAGPRLDTHDRKDCWGTKKPTGKTIVFKFAPMPSDKHDETDRRIVECCLRANTKPPCGLECNEGYGREDSVSIANNGIQSPLDTKYSCKPE